ncbi:MAG: GAF domain-containing protein [Chloroflexi bacterium]|nr:MAG: GAF domain-containing protein [Chloroflexota bacterium]
MAARAPRSTQLDELHRAVLAIGGDLDLDRTLRRILRSAAKLVGARYAALGIQSADGGFGTFITIGISARQQELIGSLPRLHGLLGTILKKGAPVRLADIRRHPDFSYYPANHPQLREFLGVPIVHRGEVLGELYFSGTAARRFSPDDQRMVEMLAAHAGVAIATARLAGRERELAALQERDRLSRRVQEAVSSALVDIIAEARAGADRAADPAAARRTLGSLEATSTHGRGARQQGDRTSARPLRAHRKNARQQRARQTRRRGSDSGRRARRQERPSRLGRRVSRSIGRDRSADASSDGGRG